MQLSENWVTGTYDNKAVRAFLARPQAADDQPLPTVLVIQEIWGVDDHIQDMAKRFAMAGYQALAPDLYSFGETPSELQPDRIHAVKQFLNTMPAHGWADEQARNRYIAELPDPEAQRIRETLGRLFGPKDEKTLVGQLKAWADWADQHGGRGVMSVGYCMGGRLSFLLACAEPRLKAAVCNYGTAPEAKAMAGIEAPVYGFYGGTDHRITDAVPDVSEQMAQLGKTFHFKIYPEAGHAFFNDSRASYDVDAARDAWAETLEFFARELKA